MFYGSFLYGFVFFCMVVVYVCFGLIRSGFLLLSCMVVFKIECSDIGGFYWWSVELNKIVVCSLIFSVVLLSLFVVFISYILFMSYYVNLGVSYYFISLYNVVLLFN